MPFFYFLPPSSSSVFVTHSCRTYMHPCTHLNEPKYYHASQLFFFFFFSTAPELAIPKHQTLSSAAFTISKPFTKISTSPTTQITHAGTRKVQVCNYLKTCHWLVCPLTPLSITTSCVNDVMFKINMRMLVCNAKYMYIGLSVQLRNRFVHKLYCL